MLKVRLEYASSIQKDLLNCNRPINHSPCSQILVQQSRQLNHGCHGRDEHRTEYIQIQQSNNINWKLEVKKKKSQCSSSISDGHNNPNSLRIGVCPTKRGLAIWISLIWLYLCSHLEKQKQLPIIPSSINPFLNCTTSTTLT